ncbi:MAG: hypothetical protein JO112_03000 [Planctomycetes bacterium]|nr:hypothetical protein [Planctomycetota bacterium]
MAHLIIQLHPEASNDGCTLCGKAVFLAEGPQLYLAGGRGVVCRDCGKKHAPALLSLLDLARTAERVGRIGRHTVSPPLAALLDLARAAENYLDKKTPRYRQAV